MKKEEIINMLTEILNDTDLPGSALLISHDLSMTGAPIELLEMADCMKALGIFAVVASPKDGLLKKEMEKRGISVVVSAQLFDEDILAGVAGLFDLVVVNTVPGCAAVSELNGADIPVLWWIHESDECYGDFMDMMPLLLLSNIRVMTDGPLAGRTLKKYRPWYEAGELLYAIPDRFPGYEGNAEASDREEKDRKAVTFAIVGSLEHRKGQDVLLKAVRMLTDEEKKTCRFIIVGRDMGQEITASVKAVASERNSNIEYIEYIDRKNMLQFYENIDCLICASRDDPMPLTVTEACMAGRAVICSENTGSAALLKQYDAGIIYHNDDPKELAACIRRVITELHEMTGMRENARRLYEENFTPEKFTESIGNLIDDMISRLGSERKERTSLDDKIREIMRYSAEMKEEERSIARLEAENAELRAKLAESEAEAARFRDSFTEINDAFFWKISKPARVMLDAVKGKGSIVNSASMIRKGLRNSKENGVADTLQKARRVSYSEWMKKPLFTEAELNEQRKYRFERNVLFSITVPLYNTEELFLREMIESVISQTYGGWELCLADGSDSRHDHVDRICREYCDRDERILYRKIEKNLGISENTNVCLEMATGEYIALFDHEDILHPSALYEMMRVICETDADIVYTDEAVFVSPDLSNIINIHFKPDYAPDNLRTNNYICHFTVFRKSLLNKTGMFHSEFDGSQDHDMMLRLTKAADRIEHIPEVLYYWRAHRQSVASGINAKEYASIAGRKAVLSSLDREGVEASVESTRAYPRIYRIRYKIKGEPLVSIVIPNFDHVDELKTCIESILTRSTYKNYEIIIIENNSREERTFKYYKELTDGHGNIRLITWEGEFNYSAINNYVVREAVTGDYILLLNNDTEVITPQWIEELLMFAQRDDVGAVGAMLYYPNDTIQHAGVIVGYGGVADHAFAGLKRGEKGYMGRLCYAQNLSAVTAACMMIRRNVWDQVDGLDENFKVAFNDTDLCMRIRKAGYLIVWTPYAELYHYESLSRGQEDNPEKRARFNSEIELFKKRWSAELEAGDPYYNPNLTLERTDFSIKRE